MSWRISFWETHLRTHFGNAIHMVLACLEQTQIPRAWKCLCLTSKSLCNMGLNIQPGLLVVRVSTSLSMVSVGLLGLMVLVLWILILHSRSPLHLPCTERADLCRTYQCAHPLLSPSSLASCCVWTRGRREVWGQARGSFPHAKIPGAATLPFPPGFLPLQLLAVAPFLSLEPWGGNGALAAPSPRSCTLPSGLSTLSPRLDKQSLY